MLLQIYSIQLNKYLTLIPVAGNYTLLCPGQSSKEHIHNVYHLMLCTCGQAVLSKDHVEISLSQGEIVVVNPGEKHIWRNVGSEEFVFFSFNFYLYDCAGGPSFQTFEDNLSNIEFLEKSSITLPYQELFPLAMDGEKVFYDKGQWSRLHRCVSEIVDYFYAYGMKAPVAKRDLLQLQHSLINFSTSVLMRLNEIFGREEPTSFSQKERLLIQNIIAYLNAHYHHRFSLSALAAQLNYSPVYLSRFFKAKTGATISEYLNRLRISKGCEYLRSTDYKMSAIAEMLGFTSPSHFTKNFKKEIGICPRQYQKSKGNIS